ncbi:uncharacterized protein PHALS_01275 [Plasmopara halstedii]|uniref:Uncharacterized protein n=1 Tax=Plasmopara halstedii TaxID=4781 RepID=A0A0P1ASH4_PLAHL|nr:uncharacterized protein PHALS_01275 [Plasmopara halstedii]CEG44952.1 hypothetical protein PHALS_01275 [Plasmopara halstedii]|eukprot:XP_024581321.1 hypothetical protein PHALS_01275 [Plasmopara halstedii]
MNGTLQNSVHRVNARVRHFLNEETKLTDLFQIETFPTVTFKDILQNVGIKQHPLPKVAVPLTSAVTVKIVGVVVPKNWTCVAKSHGVADCDSSWSNDASGSVVIVVLELL